MGRPSLILRLLAALGCGSEEPASLDAGAGDGDATVDSGAADTGGTDAGESIAVEATSMPLEVVGLCPDDASTPCAAIATHVELDAALVAGAGAAALLVTVHNVVDVGSADVRVGEGAPIDISDAVGPLLRRRGGVTSARLPLDPSVLRAGDNAIVFRYLRQVPDVSGYRVVRVAIDVGGTVVEPALPWEDTSIWAPPDPATVAEGQGYFQDVSRDGGPVCARCHVDSGADLQYFAFSSHSIVERARFHRFSIEESEAIASYLRALPDPIEGTLWDPPFQPGAGNRDAVGAGYGAAVDDEAFGEAAFGPGGLPDDIAWDWPAGVDTYRLPAPVQLPPWFRWLPRRFDASWVDLTSGGTTLGDAERALHDDPTLESAQRFMSVAVDAGTELLVRDGDHSGRVELLRFAAVKLFDWSRRVGFDAPHHGFPDGAPPYPYEVGFAFFEAALAEEPIPDAWQQVIEWWWCQLALDPGRGSSNGRRPLNWADVLLAADAAGLGENAIAFLHLYGSWEESRGTMETLFGTDRGPVRLLEIPMRRLAAREGAALMARFLVREAGWIAGGGSIAPDHHTLLAGAWAAGCETWSVDQRQTLRDLAPADVSGDLAACP